MTDRLIPEAAAVVAALAVRSRGQRAVVKNVR